jgi:hypothetical protein
MVFELKSQMHRRKHIVAGDGLGYPVAAESLYPRNPLLSIINVSFNISEAGIRNTAIRTTMKDIPTQRSFRAAFLRRRPEIRHMARVKKSGAENHLTKMSG